MTCRRRSEPRELVRWVLRDGEPIADLRRRLPGRGAWLHPTPGCLRGAVRGLARSFRRPLGVTQAELERRLAAICLQELDGPSWQMIQKTEVE